MRTAIVIPARYASSRLPGKPLLCETGKYLIQHVYERACETSAADVVVATDDTRIFQAVRSFGGSKILMAAFFRKPSGLPVAATALPVLICRACFRPAVILSLLRLPVLLDCAAC